MMKITLLTLSLFLLGACTIHTQSHSLGYTTEELRITKCGMGIDMNDKPAIQDWIDTNPQIKTQYEKCLQVLSH